MNEEWTFTGQDRADWPDWMKTHPTTAYHLNPISGLVDLISFQENHASHVVRIGETVVNGPDGLYLSRTRDAAETQRAMARVMMVHSLPRGIEYMDLVDVLTSRTA